MTFVKPHPLTPSPKEKGHICDGFMIKIIAPLPLGRGWGGAYKMVNVSPDIIIIIKNK